MLDSRAEEDQKAEGEVRTAAGGGEPGRAASKTIVETAEMDGQQQVVQQSQQQQQQQQQQPQQPQQLIVSTAGLHQQIQMQQQQQVSQQQGGTATSAQESSGPTQQTVTSGGQQVVAASSQGQQQQVSMELQQTVASTAQQVQQQALLVNTANIQQQMQVPQQVGMSTPQSPMCSANNTISTMQAQGSITQPVPANTPAPQLQQVSDWNTGRVQVLQQPVQNAYVQQLYNAQGQMLMSSNIALHPGPANINPAGSIQVITAGKPFQSNQINAHVLGKPVIAGTQQTSFPSYATIPTTTNQTLVIGSLISSQPNILPAHSGSTQQQKQEIQKTQQVKSGQNSSNSVQSSLALSGCVVSQSPTMLHHLISPIQYTTCQNRSINNNGQVQLSPWQFNTQQLPLWTPHHPQVINAQTPIFIRGPHQDQPMFIQSPPPQQSIQQQQTQSVGVANKPELKGQVTPQVSRTLSILPSMSTPIRPASSTVTTAQIIQKQPNKLRSKIMTKSIPIQKLDAQNQTKPQPVSPQQHAQTQNTKMIITSQGTLIPQPLQAVGQASQTTAQQIQQIQAAQANLQAAQQQLQQQVIQPKPPPLMSITMSTPGVPVHSPKDVSQIQGSDEKTLMEAQQAMISQDTPQVVTVSLAPSQENPGMMKIEPPLMSNAAPQAEAPATPTPTPSQQPSTCPPVAQSTAIAPITPSTPAQPTSSPPVQTLLPTIPQQTVVLSGTTNSTGQQPLMGTIPTQQQQQQTQTAHPQLQQPQQTQSTPQEIRITVLGAVDEQSQQQLQQSVAQLPQSQLQHQPPPQQQQPQHVQQTALQAQHTPTPTLALQPLPVEEEVKSSGPPKAMVKPQVLTHVIEGYVIHESSEPFPINRGSLLTEMAKTVKSKTSIKDNSTTLDADEPPLKKTNIETPPSTAAAGRGPTGTSVKRTKCESCAGDDKNKKKKFCNVSCLNRANGVSGKKKGATEEKAEKTLDTPLAPYNKKEWEMNADTNDSATSGGLESASSDTGDNSASAAAAEQAELDNLPKTNPVKWTVADVCDFIRKLPGCCDYVEDFAIQEIDGQALLLLKEDHLMSAMSMKLGPALKICARIDTLRNIAEGGGSTGQQPTAAAAGQTVGGGQPQLPAPEK